MSISSDPPAVSSGKLQEPRQEIHIIIIGAGLTGLILAQALRNHNQQQSQAASTSSATRYTFSIYERDTHAFARGGGWGLTIHWALTDLRAILPGSLIDRFNECLVNPEAAEKNIAGNFQYLNLLTAARQEWWPIPPGVSSRVGREKLMELLMDGLEIQWSKGLIGLLHPDNSSTVTAQFSDGTTATGNILVGCDGSRSQVRRNLCPSSYQNHRLPVRLLGVRILYPEAKCEKCKAIDPHFFQGGDPTTNVYFWFSFIHLPRFTEDKKEAVCQMMMAWPYKAGFHGNSEPTDVPDGDEARLAWMRTLSKNWAEPFRELVHDIPAGTEIKAITMEDWPPEKGQWDNYNGTVTLVGDAAHGMTMFRGEAANHGIIDVSQLAKLLLSPPSKDLSVKEAVDIYEEEMVERTHPAVLRSRQACLDATNYVSIKPTSPLIAKRAVRMDKVKGTGVVQIRA